MRLDAALLTIAFSSKVVRCGVTLHCLQVTSTLFKDGLSHTCVSLTTHACPFFSRRLRKLCVGNALFFRAAFLISGHFPVVGVTYPGCRHSVLNTNCATCAASKVLFISYMMYS